MGAPRLVSFCATNLNTVDRLDGSLRSIVRIGEQLGVPSEIVVADGPSDDGASERLRSMSREDSGVRVVSHTERNRGYGRRRAFEESHGDLVVPFDTSIEYDPVYGTLLRNFLSSDSPAMLFSEICAVPRSAIADVGGWRDLIGGEDVDLYARVIGRVGVLAYPLGIARSQSARLSSFSRQMRYVRGSLAAKLIRMYRVQRDQIIGANFTVGELLQFNRRKPVWKRVGLATFFGASALGARLSSIPRVPNGSTNNYLGIRDAIFESILRRDFERIGLPGQPPRLLLTVEEIEYLKRRSSVWVRRAAELVPYIGVK